MASIAAAAISAAGAIGGSLIGANAAENAASRSNVGQPQYVPLPKYAQVINRQMARATALNVDKMPPSFQDWVTSGGTATFPWTPAGLTPVEEWKLGLVDRYGGNVPGVAQSDMTPEQQIFLGQWMARHGRGGPLAKIGRLANRLDRLQAKPLTPHREKRIGNIEDRLARQLAGLDPEV